MNILVSACLVGVACRYDGKRIEIGGDMLRLMARHALIPFCPEVYAGLPTPREPSEIRGGRVYSRDGRDVTKSFLHGAGQALALARLYGCTAAVLKARSPSCGSGRIYDGTVLKILDFGAIVQVMPGRDGLLHVSQIANERVNLVSDYVKEGQVVRVKVIEADDKGRLRLSMKALLESPTPSPTDEEQAG